jgi:hypothetical protein
LCYNKPMPDSESGEGVNETQSKPEVPPAPPAPAVAQPPELIAQIKPTPEVATREPAAEVQGNICGSNDREAPSARQMVWLTAIIAFATIVNAGIFYLESESTGKQIDKLTNKAGGIVDSMNNALSDNRDALSKAFQANQKALEASERRSREALNASIAIAHNEQRAWIIVPHKYGLVDFVANGPITYSMGFINTGKTPADSVKAVVRAQVIETGHDPSFSYESGTSNTFQVGELVPNDDEPPQQLQARANGAIIVLSDEGLRRIRYAGTDYVAIYGEVTYRDIAGNHWMRFCHEVYTGPQEQGHTPQKCGQYNSSGDGGTPPKFR